jgi:hypothetical protein
MLRKQIVLPAITAIKKPIITFVGDSTIDNRIWVDGLIKSFIYTRLNIQRSSVLKRIQQSHRKFFKTQLSVVENVMDMMPDYDIHDLSNDGFTTEDCLSGANRDKVFGKELFQCSLMKTFHL